MQNSSHSIKWAWQNDKNAFAETLGEVTIVDSMNEKLACFTWCVGIGVNGI